MYKMYVTYVVNRNPFAEVTAIYTQTDKGTKEKVVFWRHGEGQGMQLILELGSIILSKLSQSHT